jgi:transposase
MHVSKVEGTPTRRIEVFTGAGRRRNWSDEEKAAILAESYNSSDSVCAVARRHGLTHSQLFGWRRAARRAGDKQDAPAFVPAVMEETRAAPHGQGKKRASRRIEKSGCASGIVEVELGGMTVRVGRGADAKTVAAVIRALKGAP